MYRYRVLIADDEIANVNGISMLLTLKCPKTYVVAKFDNGRDVIEYLKHNHVDIAILDIKMPLADGLEVAEFIYENSIDTSVLIMTGYREFEYAKRAINARVDAFIEKPIDMKYTIDKINEICLKREEKVKEQIIISNKILEENDKLNQDLKLFYYGAYSFESIKERYGNKYNFDNSCAIITFSLDKAVSYEERFWKDIGQIENEKIAVFFLANFGSSAKFIIISLKNDFEKEIEKYGEQISRLLEYPTESKCEYRIEVYKNLKQINIQKISETVSVLIESLILNLEKETELMNDIISYYSPTLLCDFISAFLDKVSENIDIDKKDFLNRATIVEKPSELLKIIREIEEIFVASIEIENKEMEDIKKYLKDNCGQEISLKSVAEKFAFNYSYLSRLFKEKTGMKFSDFMISIRVEKAKEYFAKGMYKADEVAAMVGYKNQSYFTDLFRKHSGVTPTQYIALQQLKDEDK